MNQMEPRRLSPTERLLWAVGEVLPVNVALTGRIRGRTTPGLLREALSATGARHPLLAVRVAASGPWGAWFTADGVPAPELRFVRASDPQSWTAVVEEELRRPFDTTTGPLARFVVVESGDSFDLVGIYHHLVADGLSVSFVLRDLLRALADPTGAATPAPPVVAVPVDDLLPARRADPLDLLTVARMLRGAGRPPRPSGQLAYTAWSMDTAETSSVLTRCRAEAATLQGLLCAAFARAHADLGHPSPVGIAVAADLRRILAAPASETLGLYATSFPIAVDSPGPHDLWTVARRATTDIRDRLRPEQLLPLARVSRLLRFLPRRTLSALLRRSELKRTLFDVSLSNGRVPIPVDYGRLRLESLYWAAHTSVSGAPLITIAGFDGRLFLSVTSTDGPHAAELCARAMSHLRAAVREDATRLG